MLIVLQIEAGNLEVVNEIARSNENINFLWKYNINQEAVVTIVDANKMALTMILDKKLDKVNVWFDKAGVENA